MSRLIALAALLSFNAAVSANEAPSEAKRLQRRREVSAQTEIRPQPPKKTEEPTLPPLPEGITDLKLDEIYKRPIGDRGLEFTDKAKGLNGKKVRLLGHMVRQSMPSPWKILLSPIPATVCEHEYGFCDDLPPNVVHVLLPKGPNPIAQFTPGPLLLTGTLHLGNRDEADGRVSSARLELDHTVRRQASLESKVPPLARTARENPASEKRTEAVAGE